MKGRTFVKKIICCKKISLNMHAFRAYLNMQTMRYEKSLKRIGN